MTNGNFTERQSILEELADFLYDFLPGSPNPYSDKHISFPGVAQELGLAQYWRGGSKRPAIKHLLEGTLQGGTGKFCPLVLKVVQRGMTYKRGKTPVSSEDINVLNQMLNGLGYKIPELHDRDFLHRLPHSGPATRGVRPGISDPTTIAELEAKLTRLRRNPDNRGLEFERFLSELFAHFGLAPRQSFCIRGEQIDGSFTHHSEVYLLEAKWQARPIGNAELLTFHGKVAGKAEWSRGLFISYSAFTSDGLEAFGRGRNTNFVCMSGVDLRHIVLGRLSLLDVLDRKVRRAAETNQAFVPVQQLFPEFDLVI
jgi:hypothetical protein